jgi:hypothetical protein
MMRFLVVTALVAVLSACSSSNSTTTAEYENPVDVCTAKGMGPTHPDYEKCLTDTAQGRCAQDGAPGSAENDACMKKMSEAAFTRDQIQRWGF